MNDVEKLDAIGLFEDGPDNKLVIRLLGKRYGLSAGWFHWQNWAVVAPEFEPDEWFKNQFGPLPNKGLGLMVDLYTGEWVLLANAKITHDEADFSILHRGVLG